MQINDFCLDIIIYISCNLHINILGNFLLHDKTIFFHKYSISNIFQPFDSLLYNKLHNYNIKELYAITNILSYNIVNDNINREITGIYLFNIFIKSKSSNYNYGNIVKSIFTIGRRPDIFM